MARATPWRFRWAAVAYLVLLVGVAVFVYVATSSHHQGDASFAGIWLIIVTLPGSLILMAIEPWGVPFVLEAVGLAQAALLFVLFRWLDRRWANAGG